MLVALEFVPEGNIRQTLRNNITILEKMTSSILEEERLESPFGRIKNDQINLKKLICEIVENRKNYKSSIDLKNNEDLFIRGDEERLRMAVSNVIDNAIKYSKSDKDPVEIEYFQTDNETKIIIRDYGIGIPESEIPFIFEPFYRIDKARQHKSGGYGLGMSLTKKVITAHNGSISITSATESGTVVTIKIPTSHAPKL
jgi:signal transduction histidine kinase